MGNQWCLQQEKNHSTSINIVFQQEIPRIKGSYNFTKGSTFRRIENAAHQFCIQNFEQDYQPIIARLLAHRQNHYFAAFKTVPPARRLEIFQDLPQLEIQLMDSLYTHLVEQEKVYLNPKIIFKGLQFSIPPCIRFDQILHQDVQSCEQKGLSLIMNGKVGLLLMIAGGQQCQMMTSKAFQTVPVEGNPTRMKLIFQKLKQIFNKSKPSFALNSKSPLNDSTEYESPYHYSTPIIIACNSDNAAIIENYLIGNSWFGYNPVLVKIARVSNLPILNKLGKMCMKFNCQTLTYPEGSARCLQLIIDRSKHFGQFLKENGVQYLHVLGCQDQNEIPLDPFMIGLCRRLQLNIAAKCSPPSEAVGNQCRYVRSQKNIHLLSIKQLVQMNDFNLLRSSPAAKNSMFFDLNWLFSIAQDYRLELFLWRRYYRKEITASYYDFEKNKPIQSARCYAFQKDFRDYICATSNVQLILYQRQQTRSKSSSQLKSTNS